MTGKASKTPSPVSCGCCLGPFWPLRAIGFWGCFLNLFLFFFLLKKFHCNRSPSSDVQIFVGFFLWIFPRTGEFGGRNHGSVVASPTLPISSAPEDQEETSPCVFQKKIPLLHPAQWSQDSKQPFPSSAAQGGTQRDWRGLEGRKNISRADGVHPPT